MPSAPRVLALAAALNVALLVFFVRPLYVPLDAAQYASLVGDELQAGDFNRASAVATVAAEAHPDSTELRRLASELRFLGTDFEAQQTYFMNRIATGVPLDTRAEYMALARTMRIRDWRDPGSLRSIGGDRSDLGEGPALVRLESDPSRRADPQAVEEILRDARAKPIRAEASGPSRVEGVAVHPAVNGRCEITVYYRPHARWQDRYVWLQIETAGRPPTRLSPNPPQSSVWAPDELAWDSFLTSEARTFDVSFGVQIASNPGGLLRLGRVERCRIAN